MKAITIKEKPILFSTSMVQAILDGRKTMTRRVVKLNVSGRVQLKHKQWHIDDPNAVLACPYGQVGDRLWVRETAKYSKYGALWLTSNNAEARVEYTAGGTEYFMLCEEDGKKFKEGKKPSIFMPSWASRITLEITNVRVERLQEITEEDAKAEGSPTIKGCQHTLKGFRYLLSFSNLWDSINGKKKYGYRLDPVTGKRYRYEKPSYPWSSNPFVWVVEFKKI